MSNQEELSRISAKVDAYIGCSNHRGRKQQASNNGINKDDREDIIEIPTLRKSEKTKYNWGSKYYDAVKQAVFTVKPTDSPVPENSDALTRKLYKCYQCNDSFRFYSSLKDHLQRKSWILGYWCEMCYVTKCTHERSGPTPCANCVELDTLKKLYFTVKGLKKDQKIGRIKIFLNQCQFFSHLKMHSIDTVDACDIMLMPLPCNVRSANYFQLFKMCEAVMEQMFINQIHIMDWLESMNFNDRWWLHGEDDIDTPISRIVSTYQDDCFSDTSDLYLARYNMKLLLNKLESLPKRCTSTWEQKVRNVMKKSLTRKPTIASNNNRLRKIFPLKLKSPQIEEKFPMQVVVMPEAETTSTTNQVNVIPLATDKSSESSTSKSLPIILRKKKQDDCQTPAPVVQPTPIEQVYKQISCSTSSKLILKNFITRQKVQKAIAENRRKSPSAGPVTTSPSNPASKPTERLVRFSKVQSSDKLEKILGKNYGTKTNYRLILPRPDKNLIEPRQSSQQSVQEEPQAEPTLKPVTDIKTEPIMSDVKCETLSPPVSPKLEPIDDVYFSERHSEDEYIVPDTHHMDFENIDNGRKEDEILSKSKSLENNFASSGGNQGKYIVLQTEGVQNVVSQCKSVSTPSDVQRKLNSQDGRGEFILPTQIGSLTSIEESQALNYRNLVPILPKSTHQNLNTQTPATSQMGNYAVSQVCPANTLAAPQSLNLNHIIPTTSNSPLTTTFQPNVNQSMFPVPSRTNNVNTVSVLNSPALLQSLKSSKNLIPILPKPDFTSISNLRFNVLPSPDAPMGAMQRSQSKPASQKKDKTLKICNVRSLADPKEPVNINKKETVNRGSAINSETPLTRVPQPWKTVHILEDDRSRSRDTPGQNNTVFDKDRNASNTDRNSPTASKDGTEKRRGENLKESSPNPDSSREKPPPLPVTNSNKTLVLQPENFGTQVIKIEQPEIIESPVTGTNTTSILKDYINGSKIFYKNGYKYVIRPATNSLTAGEPEKEAKSGQDTPKIQNASTSDVSNDSPMSSSTGDSSTASKTSASSMMVPVSKPSEPSLEDSAIKVNPFDGKNQKGFKDYYTIIKNKKGEDILKHVPKVAEKPPNPLAAVFIYRQELLNSINLLSRNELKKCQSHLLSTNEKFMRILKISNGSRLIRSNLNAISCFLKAYKVAQDDPVEDERYRVNEEFEEIATEWEKDFLLCGKISKCTVCKKVVKPSTYKCGLSKPARNENSYCSCYNHICPKCHIYMGSLSRFKDHWDYHNHSENKDLLFKCPQCTRKFPSFKRLEAHEWSYCFHTLSRIIYKCIVCQFDGFFNLEALSSHFAVMHSENRFSCPVCSVVVSCWMKFQEHMKTKHPEKSYSAHDVWMKVCKVGGCLVKADDFQAHMFEHLGVLQISYFKCPFCPFNYRDSSRGRTVFKEHLYRIHFQRLSKVMTKETYERLFPAGRAPDVFPRDEESRNNPSHAPPGVTIVPTRTVSSPVMENRESPDKLSMDISEESIKIENSPSPVTALTNFSNSTGFLIPNPDHEDGTRTIGNEDGENSKQCGQKRIRTRNLLKKFPEARQKGPATRCKIAFNQPVESATPPVTFRCHICRELINSSWRIMKDHFDAKHSDEYEVSILNPRIERMTLQISEGEIHLSQRKRKPEVENVQAKRKRKSNSRFPFYEDFVPL